MPVTKMTVPDIAEDLDVSTGRVRRAVRALGFSTERGTTFNATEVKRIAAKVAAISVGAK
jgi:hypothetical protein